MARSARRTPRLTLAELDQLGVSTDVTTAGRALRMSRETAYEHVKAGTFPCRVLKVGARYIVPTADLRRVLGLEQDATAGGSAA